MHHRIAIYGKHLKNDNILRHIFYFIEKFDFWGCLWGEWAKDGPK